MPWTHPTSGRAHRRIRLAGRFCVFALALALSILPAHAQETPPPGTGSLAMDGKSLKVNAEFLELERGRGLRVSFSTDLPVKSKILWYFKGAYDLQNLDAGAFRVKKEDEQIEILGPFPYELLPGPYKLKIAFDPLGQLASVREQLQQTEEISVWIDVPLGDVQDESLELMHRRADLFSRFVQCGARYAEIQEMRAALSKAVGNAPAESDFAAWDKRVNVWRAAAMNEADELARRTLRTRNLPLNSANNYLGDLILFIPQTADYHRATLLHQAPPRPFWSGAPNDMEIKQDHIAVLKETILPNVTRGILANDIESAALEFFRELLAAMAMDLLNRINENDFGDTWNTWERGWTLRLSEISLLCGQLNQNLHSVHPDFYTPTSDVLKALGALEKQFTALSGFGARANDAATLGESDRNARFTALSSELREFLHLLK